MYMSHTAALLVMILVSFLWGSWFQAVKHTGNYPIYGFLSWLYLFSIVIVWGTIAVCGKTMVPDGVWREISGNMGRAAIVLLCGAVYAIGMQLQLMAVGKVGLILSSSVTTTCSILSGIVLSALIGGISENTSMAMVMAAAVMLIAGTIVCQVAGVMRDRDMGRKTEEAGTSRKKEVGILILTSAVMVPFYSIATSVGLKTPLRPEGFSSLTCMGLLCIGAFLGTTINTLCQLSRKKQWGIFLHPDRKRSLILFMAAIAAVCHFGGNVLQAFAAPIVSVVIASGIGYSFGMWSYLWGLLYGEFKGAKKGTYGVLGIGFIFCVAGILIMTMNAA